MVCKAKIRPPAWNLKEPPYQVGKDSFHIKDLKKDYDGWVDAKLYLPFPYDLVRTKIDKKTISVWWNGIKWEGLRLRSSDVVQYWKTEEERGRGEIE